MKPEVLSGPALPNDCIATGIGSLPHRDPQSAMRLIANGLKKQNAVRFEQKKLVRASS